MPAARAAYEAEVRELAVWAARELASGRSIESVAREAVDRRNEMKHRYRADDPPALVARFERRNVLKYGHPIGPDADACHRRYGSWDAVLAAASRPARLA